MLYDTIMAVSWHYTFGKNSISILHGEPYINCRLKKYTNISLLIITCITLVEDVNNGKTVPWRVESWGNLHS